MRKKISCKVIRSIPLSESSEILRHSSKSNDKHHKISDVVAETPTATKSVWEGSHPRLRGDEFTPAKAGAKDCKMGPEPSANVQVQHSSNPVTYTERLGITRVSIDDGLTAQILDFYV